MDTNEEKQTQKKIKVRKLARKPRVWLINLWVFISLVGIMAIIAGGAAFYVWNNLQPTPKGEVLRVEVTRGMSANAVADLLEKNGIIKSGFIFGYYLQLKDEGSRFQAGLYELSPGMDNATIIAKLNAGDTVAAETIRFTIPEGYTVLQIADKLSAEGLVDKEKFLALIEDTEPIWGDAEAVRGIPSINTLHKRLEGYLFAETYEMRKESTEEDIITRMLLETDRKLGTLPDGWQDALDASGRTLHEILTIASLVEREVVVDEERALVAGVIYNRLSTPMRLQIDATVQYALDTPKARLSLSDLEIMSPYNTYKIDGLPPGPIANASLASIEAALYPADTKYLFYVTKKDGSQTHLFAETFSEHQKNIALSEQTTR